MVGVCDRERWRERARERASHSESVCVCLWVSVCVFVCVCVCVCVYVCLCTCAQSKELAGTLERVQADEQRLVHIHLKHQAAQLVILRDSLQVVFSTIYLPKPCLNQLPKLLALGYPQGFRVSGLGIRLPAIRSPQTQHVPLKHAEFGILR